MMDMYVHDIVGWAVRESLKTEGPLEALAMASRTLKPGEPHAAQATALHTVCGASRPADFVRTVVLNDDSPPAVPSA